MWINLLIENVYKLSPPCAMISELKEKKKSKENRWYQSTVPFEFTTTSKYVSFTLDENYCPHKPVYQKNCDGMKNLSFRSIPFRFEL